MSPSSAVPLAERLATLPKYFSYKDVLSHGFADDEDAFVDAWCSGALPLRIREAVLDTMPERMMELYLLRRIVRLLGGLVPPPGEPDA